MIRLLVIIAVVGFLTAIVTLGGAAALGGRDLAARDWQWNWVGGPGPWRSHHDQGPGSESTTRELTWDGTEALDLAVPAELVFTQGGTGPGQLTITGPKYIVDALTLAAGRLDDGMSHHRRGRLKILMTAPKVTRFDLGGSSRLTIGSLADLGYTVNLAAADAYSFPGGGGAGSVSINELFEFSKWVIPFRKGGQNPTRTSLGDSEFFDFIVVPSGSWGS